MADYQRGVYEPSDEVHVFDGSEDDDAEGSRLPLLIVIALFVLASFAGVVWLAYEKGVTSGRMEPRTLFADSGPAKVAADGSGGTQTPYKGLKIYEQPAPNESYDGTAVENSAPDNSVQDNSGTDNAATNASPPLRAPLGETPPARPSTETTSPDIVVSSSGSAATVPSEKPAKKVKTASLPQPEEGATAAAPATSPASGQEVLPQGAYVLQIGSYKSQAEADASWKAFQARHASVVTGFSPNVKAADLGEKGIWYRLRIGPFSDKSSANDLCDKIKSDGGNCFLSK